MRMAYKNSVEPKTFLYDYINHHESVMKYYDYSIDKKGIATRYDEISQRSYQREEVVEALATFNRRFTQSEETFDQINRLKDPKSAVVIGGQQAGLLTGPIYTVNKIISILQEAKQVEQQLQVPVVPIFWIAGEDHDIDEVNHTYFHHKDKVKRLRLNERNDVKQPASERTIRSKEASEIIDTGMRFLSETKYTKAIYEALTKDLEEDCTYVEWFAKIIHRLFAGTGLVLMDAADPAIRRIERPYFKEMIKKNDELRSAFCEVAKNFRSEGLGEPIQIDENNAHLFIHDQGQRFLLEKMGDTFVEKQDRTEWSQDVLLTRLEDDKPALSNNVVTRPLMQDLLLPVVSFIAGPGELKYWGTLKGVFHTFGIKMPLVLPRVNISFVSRRTQKNLQWMNIGPELVSSTGTQKLKNDWLSQQQKLDTNVVFDETQRELDHVLTDLSKALSPLGEDIQQLQKKFESLVKNGLQQYKQRVDRQILDSNAHEVRKFDELETELRPDGFLQERHLNIIPYLNDYGEDLILRVVKHMEGAERSFGKHLYIYL